MRFSIDELKSKADEAYEPVELELPTGEVARFENLLRLPEVRQIEVTTLLDEVRKSAGRDSAADDDDEVFDLTKLVDSVKEQLDFLRAWVDTMLGESLAGKVHELFDGDLGYYLFVFNSWMGKEGERGEAKPSAD